MRTRGRERQRRWGGEWVGAAAVAILGLGCSGQGANEDAAETMAADTDDPTGMGPSDGSSEGDGDADGSGDGDGDEDTTEGCEQAAVPERFIVFGDSILACSTINGGKTGQGCSARLVHDHLESRFGASITYENAAVGGAVTADVIGQMNGVDATQPGHALVLIGIGGNDLSGFLLTPDSTAMNEFDSLSMRLDEAWEDMLDWLLDEAHFPDGLTLVVDNQYNPFDDCSADPYSFMSPLKTELLGVFNDRVAERLEVVPNAQLSDLYLAFLGHGHHYRTEGCPHTKEGAEYWMIGGTDLIHPGIPGHAGIAVEVESAIDRAYACN
jgi:hypothetical protein